MDGDCGTTRSRQRRDGLQSSDSRLAVGFLDDAVGLQQYRTCSFPGGNARPSTFRCLVAGLLLALKAAFFDLVV